MGGFFLKLKELFSQKTWHCGRGLLVAVVLLALCGMQAWGVDYYWAGGGAANDWNDPNNWNPNTGYPQAGDNVYIYDGPLTFNQAVQAATITVNAYSLITFNGNADLGTVYVHGGSSLDFAAGVTINDLNVYANGGTSNIPINIGGASSSIGTYNFFDNGSGLDDASTITVASGASLDIGSGTIPTLVNEGTVNATGSVTVNDYRGSGSNTGLTILSGGGTPTTYYWIGEGTANTWNDKDNWSTDDPTVVSSPTPATDFPKSGDTAIFNTADAHSFSENITVAKIEITNGAEIEFSGTVAVDEIENNGKIATTNSLTLGGYSGTGEMESSGTITVASASNVTISKLTMVGDSTVTNSGAGGTTIGTLSGAYTLAIDTNNKQCTINGYDEIDVPSLECSGNNMRLRAGKISSLKVNTAIVVLLGNLNVVNNVDLVVAGGSLIDGKGQSLTVDGDLNIDGSIGGGGGRELGSLLVKGKTEIKTRNRWDSLVVTGNVILGDGTGTDEFVNDGTVNVGGTLTVNGATTNNAGASILTTGDQTYTGDITNSGTMNIPAGATLTLGGDFTNTGTLKTDSTSNIIVNGAANQTIDFGTSTINVESFTYSPTAAAQTLTITTPNGSSLGDFTATTNTGNANIIIHGNNKFKDFTTNIVASITMYGSNEFTGDFTASGNTNITLSGSNTFNNFSFTGDTVHGGDAEITLGSANTFNNFEFKNGDSLTVNVNAAQTVTGTLSLSGKSSTNKLAVGGSGSFVVSGDQTARFLSVNRDAVKITDGGGITTTYTCTAYNSEDANSDPALTLNGWTIEAGGQTITWTGAVSTDWNNAGNWDLNLVPGLTAANNGGVDTTIYSVVIPAEYPAGTAITKFPTAAAEYTVSDITIESNASVTIASGSNVTFSEIVNGGKLITNADFEITNYSGSGSIENSAALTFNLSDDTSVDSITNSGTIEKSGTADLTITTLGGSTCTLKRNAGKINVNGYSATDVPEIVVDGSDVFLAGGTIASLTVNDGPSGSSYTIANLTGDLTVTGNVTLQGGNSIIQSDGTASLIVESNIDNSAGGKIGNTASRELASLEVTGTTTNAGQIETTGNQKYTGAVTNSGTMVVPAQLTLGSGFTNTGTYDGANSEIIATTTSSGGIIDFGTTGINAKSFTYSPTGAANLVINGKATFTGDFTALTVGNAALTLNGTTSFNNFTFTDSSTTLTVNAAQTVTGTLTLSGEDKDHSLTIAGDGQFNLSSEQTAKYLVVGTDVKICDSTGTALPSGDYLCKALYSKYSDGTTGIKNGWCIVGDTITWTGGANTTAWTTPGNWDVGIVPGIDNSGSGGEDDTVYKVVIPVKYNGSNIGDYPVAAAAYTVKGLKIGGDETISDSMADGVPSITLGAGSIEVTGTFENYGKIIYSGAGRITDGTDTINDVTNNGTVQYTTGATTLTDFDTGTDADYYNLIINDNVSFSGSSLSVSNNFNIESSGKYTATGSKITIGGNFENNGTFSDGTAEITVTGILNDDNSAIKFAGGTNGVTVKEFKYEPTTVSGAKLEISGENTFTNFTASSLGGATLIIKGTQTVTNLTLSGDSTAPLTIDGDATGSFTISSDQTPGEFLLIERDKVSICDGNESTTPYFYATNSSYNSSTPSEQYGLHKRWFILNENMEFIWEGDDLTDPTEWNEKSNWNLGMVPGLDTTISGAPIDTRYYNVKIPDGCPEWPIVSGEYKIKDLTIGTEINSTHDAQLEIASGGNLILSDNPSATSPVDAVLTNYGTIIYSAESRINDDTNPMNDAANGGTVQYIGADVVTLTDFASDDGDDYANLIIDSTVDSSFGASGKNIVVAGKAEINVNEIKVKTFTFKGDVATDTLKINGSVFIFGNGNLLSDTSSSATSLEITEDLILLGKDYNIDDKQDSLQSQVEGLFAYNHSGRKSPASCTDYFPSDTAIAACSGVLTIADGSTITVGKNFYANGIKINDGVTDAWTLEIPDNDSQTSAFAELYNSSIENCTVTGGVVSAAEKGSTNTVTGCTGVETKRPLIKEAYTVYDDVIFVSFKYEDDSDVVIENSENEISAVASRIFHKVGENANVAFAGTYIDANCTTSTDGKGDITSSFYIKTANKWNTDASGISAGVSSESTDRSGTHRTVVPYLNLPKALNTLYETLRDKYKNRIAHYYSAAPNLSAMSGVAGKTYTKVEDQCAPVLVAVYTGQEMHTSDVAQQKDYDAHNFIEYRYSEPVVIGDGTITVDVSDVNIQATAGLGAVTNNGTGFKMAGLGIFSDGKIDASLRPEKTGEPHSFYRNFSLQSGGEAVNHSYKIRVSIAGYVDGTVAGDYKNWAGYISSAVCPRTGVATVLPDANSNITDLATDALGNPKNNALDSTGATNHAIVPITVNKELVDAGVSSLELYGTWDVTPPSFAPMRTNEMATWTRPATDGTAEYEIVGMSYSEGMLSAVEFHMFDNEPTYNETLQWFSRIGWAEVNPSEPTEYEEIISYAADIIGGSRPYSSNNTTSGGIRYSSVYDSKDAFVYSANEAEFKNFSGVQQFAQSSFFKYIDGDKNPIDTNDGHYLSLALDPSDTMLTGETNFVIKFDSSACFITDLAGNRIQCGNITMKSIDRAPPTFNISAVPLGNKKMLIVFAKAVAVENIELYTNAHSKQTLSALENIPKSLVLKDADGNPTDIQITNEPAQCVFRSKKATGIVVTLNRDATLNDVVNGTYITVENGGTRWYDPLCGTMGEVTYIQDEIGNFIRVGKQHTFSDFAVDAVQMQYAYPILDHSLDKYDLNQGTFIMRDWNAEQERSGYINEKKEIILHGALYDGTNNNTGGLNEMLQDANNSVTAYFDASPSENSVGDKINNLMQGERTWRIWLPSTQNDIFENFASENNVADFSVDGDIAKAAKATEKRFINFDVPEEVSAEKWKAGDQVEFLFKLGNYTVCHNGPDEDPQPLYCLRLKDSLDLTSLDLWSFKMKEVTLQRGGVTILANVINVNAKEKTTVQVDMQEAGNLSVMVMTLDGNIVKYLHHGKAEKGSHYYMWDGTNNGGSPVARGLYFVRVIGPGIDETRKVMCVKK